MQTNGYEKEGLHPTSSGSEKRDVGVRAVPKMCSELAYAVLLGQIRLLTISHKQVSTETCHMCIVQAQMRILLKPWLVISSLQCWLVIFSLSCWLVIYRRYIDAARCFNTVLAYINRTKQYHVRSVQYDQVGSLHLE
jgi:hypothetical protein